MIVHLIDGTFELFRYFLSPAATFDRSAPEELRAVRGVVGSVLGMLEGGATHVGVATDHVIESFRNALWPGYKTGEGIDPLLYAQFQPLEEALAALGVVVWPMVEFEADDALAAAAAMAAADARVNQVVVCSPDKDLAQCVSGDRIVQLDRRTRALRNEAGVRQKFGVLPASIPDWLALVGDSADGYPGLPNWGATSAATVLARYRHLDHIPHLVKDWAGVGARRDAAGRNACGAARAGAAVPATRHAAYGCAHRRRRGRAALERTARGLRGLGGASRRPAAPGARRDTGRRALRGAERPLSASPRRSSRITSAGPVLASQGVPGLERGGRPVREGTQARYDAGTRAIAP